MRAGRDERAQVRWSELELEGELNRARAADLVQRVEAAIVATGAEAARKRLRGVAKQRAGQVVIGIAEVGVVEDIEELGAEAKPQPLGEPELALQGHIGLPGSETAQHIASEIALLSSGRRSERCFIENLAAGILRSMEHERHPRRYVGPWVEDDT